MEYFIILRTSANNPSCQQVHIGPSDSKRLHHIPTCSCWLPRVDHMAMRHQDGLLHNMARPYCQHRQTTHAQVDHNCHETPRPTSSQPEIYQSADTQCSHYHQDVDESPRGRRQFSPATTSNESHPETQMNQIFADCKPITGQIYSDLPGKFIVPSSHGYNYLLIVYNYDSKNAILAEPLKNRTAHAIITAHKRYLYCWYRLASVQSSNA
jgi:hypothetical protein